MDDFRLSPRLRCIAELVPAGCRLADVGTDHAFLPLALLARDRIVSAVATDIRPGPLSRAEKHRREAGADELRCVLCDGLQGVDSSEADAVVIAGMGGENAASILAASPWSLEKLLILQPMSRPEVLRRFLAENGLAVTAERIVRDNGKLYSVFTAERGVPGDYSEAEWLTGKFELISRETLFLPYIRGWEDRTRHTLEGLSRSGKPEDAPRTREQEVIYQQIREMKKRYADGI